MRRHYLTKGSIAVITYKATGSSVPKIEQAMEVEYESRGKGKC